MPATIGDTGPARTGVTLTRPAIPNYAAITDQILAESIAVARACIPANSVPNPTEVHHRKLIVTRVSLSRKPRSAILRRSLQSPR